jgi:hypothetical protein
VRKAHHHFFDEAIVTEGLRQRDDLQIRRDVREEFIRIERTNSGPAYPSYSGGDHEDVRVFGHRCESRIRIFEYEFGVGVLLPGGQHGLLIEREATHRKIPFGGRSVMANEKLGSSACRRCLDLPGCQ